MIHVASAPKIWMLNSPNVVHTWYIDSKIERCQGLSSLRDLFEGTISFDSLCVGGALQLCKFYKDIYDSISSELRSDGVYLVLRYISICGWPCNPFKYILSCLLASLILLLFVTCCLTLYHDRHVKYFACFSGFFGVVCFIVSCSGFLIKLWVISFIYCVLNR